MASFTLASVNDLWPDGTSVGAYALDALGNRAAAPTESAPVSSGALTFTALAAETAYQAFASGVGRRFRTNATSAGTAASEATLQSILGEVSTEQDVNVADGALGLIAGDPEDGAGNVVTIKTADISATTDGDNSIIAAVASKRLRILGISGTATGAGLVTFKDGATVKRRMRFAAAGDGFVHAGGLDCPFMTGTANTAFQINVAAGVDFEGGCTYIEIT